MTLVYNNQTTTIIHAPAETNPPAEVWVVQQGATNRRTLFYLIDGAAVDLTGCTAKLQVRSGPADSFPDVLLELSTDTDSIILTPATGKIELIVAPTDTVATPAWTRGVFDLKITHANGDVSRIWRGIMQLAQEVTR